MEKDGERLIVTKRNGEGRRGMERDGEARVGRRRTKDLKTIGPCRDVMDPED